MAAKEYQAALEAAEQAARYLKPVFRSWALAQLNIIECQFSLGKSEEALKLCDELLADERLVALHHIRALETKSRILAALDRHAESLQTLQACREAEAKRDSQRASEVAQFIIASYDGGQSAMPS